MTEETQCIYIVSFETETQSGIPYNDFLMFEDETQADFAVNFLAEEGKRNVKLSKFCKCEV